jgi:hypothetical protein
MNKNKTLYNEMKLHKKVANEILFCEQAIQTIQEHFALENDFNAVTTRKREYVYARQIAMTLIGKHTRFSLGKIGQMFGGKDHATVLHSKRTICDLMETSKAIKAEVLQIEKTILYKVKVISQKQTANEEYYYINFDNYTSIKYADDKGIILTGFSSNETDAILQVINEKFIDKMNHKNTGHYILEKISHDSNTRN